MPAKYYETHSQPKRYIMCRFSVTSKSTLYSGTRYGVRCAVCGVLLAAYLLMLPCSVLCKLDTVHKKKRRNAQQIRTQNHNAQMRGKS